MEVEKDRKEMERDREKNEKAQKKKGGRGSSGKRQDKI